MTSLIPSGVVDGVKEVLNLPDLSSIREFSFAGGGSINQGGKLKTTLGSFFLKWNDDKKFPGIKKSQGYRPWKKWSTSIFVA
jgi:hypothetical protein